MCDLRRCIVVFALIMFVKVVMVTKALPVFSLLWVLYRLILQEQEWWKGGGGSEGRYVRQL